MKVLSLIVASTAALTLAAASRGATLAFQAAAPTPGASDVYNLTGGSRDGLNVNNTGTAGQDGSLNDAYTYVAADRTTQGQSFTTGSNAGGYTLSAIYLQMVGYTNNGSNRAAGYNGTYWNTTGGGTLAFRVTQLATTAAASVTLLDTETYNLTGSEANNPGNSHSDNGLGRWIKITFSSPITLAANTLYGFDVASTNNTNNRFFEWLGDYDSTTYTGGGAYNGTVTGGTTGSTSSTSINELGGDRVFLVSMTAVAPSPAALPAGLALMGGVLLGRRR